MSAFFRRHRIWIFTLLVLAAAAIVWAATQGQADALAQDAGDSSTDMEMATLDTIEPPSEEVQAEKAAQSPDCDWSQERDLRHMIEANNDEYKQLTAQAQSEMGGGAVSSGTRDAVMASANEHKALQDQYAAMWSACDCRTRANVATESGNTRLANAEVVVGGANSDNMENLEASQAKLKTARSEYAQDMKQSNELSADSKARIRASARPRAEALLTDVTDLVLQITSLVNEISSVSSMSGGDVASAAAGCAASAASGGDMSLLTNARTLLILAEAMLTNAESLITDIDMLTE
ncbi:MAG: hypothetical protein D6E12_06445 [Desulfovibrio sp.]|nr:MAG: hypothetical protein D6E12_06445 [Desulfovibrio sp.]